MKICLIGSTRFLEKYYEWNQKLTKMGHVVYSVSVPSSQVLRKTPTAGNLTDDEKETLDLVHLLKIQNSDVCVLITDDTGYVGFSTKREIKWALMIGKQIMLPEQFKGVDEAQKSIIEDWIPKALREISNSQYKSKLDLTGSNVKI